ncbi:hypothetical protein [Demequina sp. NBRC 110056]|uniref:hypothetical protein n=1 Tax=Demequina sp. NBRC 110056 TaxID=1570345 RepID=UPI00117C3878|nr:hypothetical protein [Demequina sp. NBRC 110056]
MRALPLVAICVVALGGCAQAAGGATPTGDGGPVGGILPTATGPSSIACPIQEGVELPPECVPYDPQALFDANERYRDRMPLAPESFAAFEAEREAITAVLEALAAAGTLTPESAIQVLVDAGMPATGLDGASAFEEDGVVTFSAVGPVGGCVSGTVSDGLVEMQIQGVIMDGGCYAATGH